MGEWKEYKVVDLIASKLLSIGDGYRAKNMELSTTGIPFARVANIDGGFDFSDADKFPEEDLEKVGDKISRTGDIVFTSKGTVGRFAYVSGQTQRFVYSPQLSYWRSHDQDVIDSRFLFYWMQGRGFYGQVEAVKGQTDMADYVSLSDQRQMLLSLPEPSEQRAIASMLSSLDDKIDLLHRQNKTLERLAETLFRQWFVEDAREEWDNGILGDVSINVHDNIKPENIASDMPYVGLEHLDQRQIIFYRHGKAEDIASNKSLFKKGDILFGKLRPYFHKVCFAPFAGVCSTDILVIRPKDSLYYAYCLFAFFQKNVVDYSDLSSEGTRMPRTNWHVLSQYPIKIPDKITLSRFNDFALSLVNKIEQNRIQIDSLTQLRNTLLPKLMSGEVRVRVSSQIASEVIE